MLPGCYYLCSSSTYSGLTLLSENCSRGLCRLMMKKVSRGKRCIAIAVELYDACAAAAFLIAAIVVLSSDKPRGVLHILFLPNFLSIILKLISILCLSIKEEGGFGLVIFKASVRFLVSLSIYLITSKISGVITDVSWISLLVPLFMVLAVVGSVTLILTIYFIYRLIRFALLCRRELEDFLLTVWIYSNASFLLIILLLLIILFPKIADGLQPVDTILQYTLIGTAVTLFLGVFTLIFYKRL
jgi:hypothetical protein